MVPNRVPEYEKQSSGCSTCCIVTAVILSLLAILSGLFLLSFFGIISFGHDGGVIKKVEQGVEIATRCEYNGPWGTTLSYEIDGETVVSHTFWGKNLLERIPATSAFHKLSGNERAMYFFSGNYGNLLNTFTVDEIRGLIFSLFKQVPLWAKNNAKRYYFDKKYAENPSYPKWEPYVQPMLDLLYEMVGKLDLQKLDKLVQNKDWEGVKNEIFDYYINLVLSNAIETVTSDEFKPLYYEWRAFCMKVLPQLKQVPIQVWKDFINNAKAANAIASLENAQQFRTQKGKEFITEITKYAPTIVEDFKALWRKTETRFGQKLPITVTIK